MESKSVMVCMFRKLATRNMGSWTNISVRETARNYTSSLESNSNPQIDFVEVVVGETVDPSLLDSVGKIVAQLRGYRLDRLKRSLDGGRGQAAGNLVDMFTHIYQPPCTIVDSIACVAL